MLTNGASLIAQMLKALIGLGDGEPPLWTNTAMEDLIVEDGRVVGARVKRDGSTLFVEARRGVLLAAGGFGHNADMRRRYSGDQPNEGKWSIANPGDTGEVLQTAMRLGARTDLLDEAWWLPSVFIADGGPPPGRSARDGSARGPSTSTRPAGDSATSRTPTSRWARRCTPTRRCRAGMVFDEGYVGRYVSGANPLKKRRLPEELIERGAVVRGATIADLARQIDVPADELEHTIQRFNEFAAKGLDPDFGRGQSAYNDCLGDPGYRPNAALGPLERAPYYATRVLPGRCRDVRRRDHQRARAGPRRAGPGDRGSLCDGQHTATVMGRTYPGAGASIASTMVFGYVAARHAAGALGRRAFVAIDEIPWLQT